MPEIDIKHSYEPSDSTSPPDSAPPVGYHHIPHAPSAGIAKKRKNSKIKMSPILKRASSTPHLNGLSAEEAGALSPTALDKRRNKLGYQRISIACSHCRRRKIRCVLAEGDDMSRCNNCIRLKKDCVFYPVDSAAGPESRAQTKGSKASSVMSNSPSEMQTLGSQHEHDHDHDMGRFHLASNAPSEYSSIDPSNGLGISTGTPVGTSEFAFVRPSYPPIYTGDMSGTEPPTPVHWSSSQMGEYPNYPNSTVEHSPNVYSTYNFPSQRNEYTIQPPPLRSMSYGHIEPQLGEFRPPTTSIEYTRPGSAHYTLAPHDPSGPPVCTMSEASMTPVTSEPTMNPLGMYPPQQWGFYQQQQQQAPMGMDYSSRHDSLPTQWYHPQQLGSTMTEHDLHHHHHHQQQHPMSHAPGSGYGKGT